MSVISTSNGIQTLKCRNCDKTWEREASAGRPPVYCDDCRVLGPSLLKAQQPSPPRPQVTPLKGGYHKAFKTLLAVCKARVPAMLVGPAGSGKTTAGRQVAQTLDLTFVSESCNPMMSKWDLFGFMNASGGYVKGVLRDAFEFGGVVLLDEMDASNPAVLVAINMVVASMVGETITFPDGANVPRHPDFILIAGANTYGDGASNQYVGREQLDAATLDRFACIEWAYDETLEFVAAGADADEWVTYVQRVRSAAESANVELLVTPRASINGAILLREGMPRRTVEELTVWKGVSPEARRSVKALLNF